MVRHIQNLFQNRKLFKALYLVFLVINIVPVFNTTVASRILLGFFGLWGIGLIIADLIVYQYKSYIGRVFPAVFIFFCLCGISYLVNFDCGVVYNIGALGIFFLCAAVFYITGSDRDVKDEALFVGQCYSFITLLLSIACLVIYFLQIQFQHVGRNGNNIRLGVWENRLFGLFTSSNVGGGIIAIGIFISLGILLYLRSQKALNRRMRVMLIANMIFGYWYIALSLSRGTCVSSAIAIIVFFLFYGFKPSKHWMLTGLKKAACIALSLVILYAGIAALRFVSVKSVVLLSKAGVVEEVITGTSRIEYADDEIEDEDDKPSDISNKRFAIWKGNVNLMKDKWYIGVGDSYRYYHNNIDSLTDLSQKDHVFIEWSKGNLHNGYLQIFVDCGAFALTVYLVFLICCLIKNISAYVKANRMERCVLAICLAILCFVLSNNLFETNMALKGANPIQAAFWFVAGVDMSVCCRILNQYKKEKSEKISS